MSSDLPAFPAPYVLAFGGVEPRFAARPVFSGPGSSVLGRVEIGARARLGQASVIRADGHDVRIGDDFCIGANSTVHIAHEIYPTHIGNRVLVGRNAVVHACTVGDDCVIEDNAVVLDGSVVENGVLLEAGSTVYPRSTLKSGLIYGGSPAKPVRELQREEALRRRVRLHDTMAIPFFMPTIAEAYEERHPHAFVARTASLNGRVELGAEVNVLYSCLLDAGAGSIVVGERTNIQDNTRMECGSGVISIGPDTTIGHNVAIEEARIGARCLIGIGSMVAAGTVVGDDVLLAAGSVTQAGQQIESGWLWAGRPARPIARLGESKRAMMREIVEVYCSYGEAYRELQRCLAN